MTDTAPEPYDDNLEPVIDTPEAVLTPRDAAELAEGYNPDGEAADDA
jgi:hypothetical protein